MTVSAGQVTQMKAMLGRTMAQTVAVETFQGETGIGPKFAASSNVTCNVSASRRLVRNAEGEEVTSEFTIHVPAASEASFTPHSRVTIGSRVSTVLAVSPKSYRGQVVYVEVACA
jgi:hypothetical protein